jgi:peptidoglycan/xylan/chitin deacetylase (PgdA/CDA1 family)
MATKTLAVKFTSEGFEDLRKQLSSVTKSFDETFQKAIQGSQGAIAASKAAAGDTNALAQAQRDFERAAKQANAAIAGSFRELRVKSTADIEAQKAAAVSAFESIKKSGTASAQDIKNAQAALEQKLKSLDDQLDQTGKKAVAWSDRLKVYFTTIKVGSGEATDGLTAMKVALGNIYSSVVIGGFQKITGAIQGFVQNVYQAGVTTENLKAQLKTIEGSAEGANKAYEKIAKFAIDTPYELEEVTRAYVSLANRGMKPTEEQLKKIGDLASSQQKPLQQYVEAILDAMTGENERLKEFGIKAKQSGDQVSFTFKGITKTVEKSEDAIYKALLGFSEMDGVLGGMNEKAKTTEGKLSNITDALKGIYVQVFDAIKPALNAVQDVLIATLSPLGKQGELFQGISQQAKEFADYLKQNPQLAQELNKALTEGVKVALTSVSDLAKGILGYLQKNPTAIADAVRQMEFLVKAMGEFYKLIALSVSGWEKIVGYMKVASGGDKITPSSGAENLRAKGGTDADVRRFESEVNKRTSIVPFGTLPIQDLFNNPKKEAIVNQIYQEILKDIEGRSKTSAIAAPSSDAIVAKTGGAVSQDPRTRGRSTGPHLHAQAKGEQMTEAQLRYLVDKYLDLNGKSASDYGTSRGSAGHGYLAIDFTTPQGTSIKLKNGASINQFGPAGGRGGLMGVVTTPEGRFQIGHLLELNPSGATTAKAQTSQPSSASGSQQSKPAPIDINASNVESVASRMAKGKTAITFDDGPDPLWTPQVLDELKRNGMKATFFVLGKRAEQYPELIRRAIAEGHEIGVHSYSHPDFTKISQSQRDAEIRKTLDVLKKIAPSYTPSLFRFPYGAGQGDPNIVQGVKKFGLTPVYWTGPDAGDWKSSATGTQIAKDILSNGDQGIILLHDALDLKSGKDGKLATTKLPLLDALKIALPELKKRGVVSGSLSSLLGLQRGSSVATASPQKLPYQDLIFEAAAAYGIDPLLYMAKVRQESGFDPRAKSPVGAMGLAQLMPGTAKEMGVKNPFDPRQSLFGGAKYFRQMLDQFNQSVPLALAAYNAGPGNVIKAGGIPNFKETRNHVKLIMGYYDEYKKSFKDVAAEDKIFTQAQKDAKAIQSKSSRDFEKEQQEIERIQQRAFDGQTTRQKQRQKAELDNLRNDKDRQVARLKLQGASEEEIKKAEQLLSLNIQLKELEQARSILVAKRTEKARQIKGGAKNVDPYDYSFDISQLDRQKAFLKEMSGLNASLLSEQEKQAILERTFQKQSEARQKDQKNRLEAFRQATELEIGRMKLANKTEDEIAKYQAEREQKLKLQENAFGMENLRIEKSEQDRKKRLGVKTDNRDFDPDINALVRDRRFLENQYQINQVIADQKRGYNVLPGQTDLGLGRINLVPFGQSSPTSPEAMGNPLLETLKPSTSFLSDQGIFSEVRESWIKTLESVFGDLATAIAKRSGVTEMLQVDYGSKLPMGFGNQPPDLSGEVVLSRQDQIAQIRAKLEVIDREQILNQARQNEDALKQNEILKARLELEQRILEIQEQQTQGKLTADEAQQRIDLEKAIADERLKQLDSTKTLGDAFGEIGQGAFAKFFQDTITGTQSVSDAFKAMAQSVLSTVSDLAAQMATVELFKLLGMPTKGGDSLPSIGSLFGNLFGGGNSGDRGGNAPSLGSFSAENASNSFNPISGFSGLLSGLLGFADGGFTGVGGKYEPKGIVHGNEFVLNSFATRNLGVDLLEKVNSTGKLPTLAMPANFAVDTSANNAKGQAGNTITINNNYPEASQRFLTQSRTLAREQAEAIARAMK